MPTQPNPRPVDFGVLYLLLDAYDSSPVEPAQPMAPAADPMALTRRLAAARSHRAA